MLGLIVCCFMIVLMFFRVFILFWEFLVDNIFLSGLILIVICKLFCMRIDIGIDICFIYFNILIIIIFYFVIDCKILYYV